MLTFPTNNIIFVEFMLPNFHLRAHNKDKKIVGFIKLHERPGSIAILSKVKTYTRGSFIHCHRSCSGHLLHIQLCITIQGIEGTVTFNIVSLLGGKSLIFFPSIPLMFLPIPWCIEFFCSILTHIEVS